MYICILSVYVFVFSSFNNKTNNSSIQLSWRDSNLRIRRTRRRRKMMHRLREYGEELKEKLVRRKGGGGGGGE